MLEQPSGRTPALPETRARVLVLVPGYPAAFKSYYDTQFGDLIDADYDLVVLSGRELKGGRSEKVLRYGLHRTTGRYPVVLRDLVRALPKLFWALGHPGQAGRAIGTSFRRATSIRSKLIDAARGLVVASSRPDFVLLQGTMAAVHFNWIKTVFPRVPVAFYYHGGEIPTGKALSVVEVARAFNAAHAVFTNTAASRQQAIDRGCPAARIHVLPVGLAPGEYPFEPNRSYRKGGLVRLVSVGRLSEEKGILVALEALREVIEVRGCRGLVHYTIVGDGQARAGLERYVREHSLSEYVTFLGYLPPNAAAIEMARSDALLLPSLPWRNWVETQAVVAQEAMLMGTLVIASRLGGIPESVAPELDQYLIPPGNRTALADAIVSLGEVERVEFERLGRACRRFVRENYDVRDLNRRLISTTVQAYSQEQGG